MKFENLQVVPFDAAKETLEEAKKRLLDSVQAKDVSAGKEADGSEVEDETLRLVRSLSEEKARSEAEAAAAMAKEAEARKELFESKDRIAERNLEKFKRLLEAADIDEFKTSLSVRMFSERTKEVRFHSGLTKRSMNSFKSSLQHLTLRQEKAGIFTS